MTNHTEPTYEQELFDRLKKSISFKKQTESIGCIIQPNTWWMIEQSNPSKRDLGALISETCTCAKKADGATALCYKMIMSQIKRAADTRALTKFDCPDGLRGFIYPIAQGDKLYGYIGACYRRHDVSADILDVFAAFTDTIVREIQKELELSKLYETIRPRAIALSTVHTVHRLISSTLDLNELLPRVARLSLQVMRANRCSIKLIDSRRKVLLPKATVDLRSKRIYLKKVKVGKFAPGRAVKYGRSVRSDSYLATPLIDDDIVGVITIYDKIDNKPFTAFDQEIMSTLAEQAVIAIKNAQLYKEQEKLTMGSIKSLATVLDSRAPGTYIPRTSFVRITLAIGQALHLDTESLKSLEYAAILHDAGEIFVPQEVLSKPTKLTGKEYKMIREHPVVGVEIIKHIKALKSVTPIIMYHHENFDGSGYPKGLKKEQIPIGARIMAVVSAFEAMIAKRPYRTARTIEESIEEIKKYSGSQFDPKIVLLFLSIVKRKDIDRLLQKELHSTT